MLCAMCSFADLNNMVRRLRWLDGSLQPLVCERVMKHMSKPLTRVPDF